MESPRNVMKRTSRRRFLQGAACVSVLGPVVAQARQSGSKPALHRVLVCVGTYSSPQGPEGSRGRRPGIYVLVMNPTTGALTQREIIPTDANPSWATLHPSGGYLYLANIDSISSSGNPGSVSAYAVDRTTGHLTLVNTVSSEGVYPSHLSVHPSGRYALVANHGGTEAVLPIRASGELGPATDVVHNHGALGAKQPHSAPVGSFAISGHEN